MPLPSIPYMKPTPGVQINPLHPLSRGLVACFLFNEGAGSRANDISGHGNHGTLKNMLPNAQGSGWGGSKYGGALKFDGVDDYVFMANNTSLSPTDSSISIWFKMNVVGYDMLVGRSTNSYPFIAVQSATNIRIRNDIGTYIDFTVPTISADDWYHLLVTRKDNTTKVYFNAVESTTGGQTLTSDITIDQIGRLEDGVGWEWSYFNGSIDSVRIYNRALSAEEVKTLYRDPFCNLLRVPVRYVPAAPSGLPIPIAMNYYRRRRVA